MKMAKETCLLDELRKAVLVGLEADGLDAEARDQVMKCADAMAGPCPVDAPASGVV